MPKRPNRQLRSGFSTGAAAAAAAGAAVRVLLGGEAPARVVLALPIDQDLAVPVVAAESLAQGRALARVIKDAGDDPDVTHKAAIEALVEDLGPGEVEEIALEGGVGVGRVTRPGLPVPVGQAAINPVPREMIAQAVRTAWREAGGQGPARVRVTIAVPEGERLAERTLNPRLGIEGGISILGTTGLVKPLSHAAYTATIASALRVARASGVDRVVFTTGRRSEKRAMALLPQLPELAFVQMGDFFQYALEEAAGQGMVEITLVSFFAKAVKQAMAQPSTHAHRAPMDLGRLAEWLTAAGLAEGLTREVARANTARHAFDILGAAGAAELAGAAVGPRVLRAMAGFAGPGPDLAAIILDYDGAPLWQGRGEA